MLVILEKLQAQRSGTEPLVQRRQQLLAKIEEQRRLLECHLRWKERREIYDEILMLQEQLRKLPVST